MPVTWTKDDLARTGKKFASIQYSTGTMTNSRSKCRKAQSVQWFTISIQRPYGLSPFECSFVSRSLRCWFLKETRPSDDPGGSSNDTVLGNPKYSDVTVSEKSRLFSPQCPRSKMGEYMCHVSTCKFSRPAHSSSKYEFWGDTARPRGRPNARVLDFRNFIQKYYVLWLNICWFGWKCE